MILWDYVFDGHDYVPSYLIDERKPLMSTKINFVPRRVATPKGLHFEDLDLNESFRNKYGRGAIYRKVMAGSSNNQNWYMLEEATGRLWTPTQNEVERVNVEVNIDVSRPKLYS